jgi:hypothetical protein
MAPPRGRTKELRETRGQNAVKPDTLIPSSHLSTKPGQVQYRGFCDRGFQRWRSSSAAIDYRPRLGQRSAARSDDAPQGLAYRKEPPLFPVGQQNSRPLHPARRLRSQSRYRRHPCQIRISDRQINHPRHAVGLAVCRLADCPQPGSGDIAAKVDRFAGPPA